MVTSIQEGVEIIEHQPFVRNLKVKPPNTIFDRINRLQLVLNTPVSVVTLVRKYDHMTPAMKSLLCIPTYYF